MITDMVENRIWKNKQQKVSEQMESECFMTTFMRLRWRNEQFLLWQKGTEMSQPSV